jgi:hypothetical protein
MQVRLLNVERLMSGYTNNCYGTCEAHMTSTSTHGNAGDVTTIKLYPDQLRNLIRSLLQDDQAEKIIKEAICDEIIHAVAKEIHAERSTT